MAKKKLVTLADVKAAAMVDLVKEFEADKKIIAKTKDAFRIENLGCCSNKTIRLIDRFIDQEEDSK